MVPLRCDGVGLAAALKVIARVPVPLVTDVIVSHDGADETAVHAQVGPAATMNIPPPPVLATLLDAGLTAYVHGGAGTTVTLTGTASNPFTEPGAAAASRPV